MRLRSFGLIVTLALGLLVAPLVTEAQQPGRAHRIGVLLVGTPANVTAGAPLPEWILKLPFGAFVGGLKDIGWIEGRNVVFELRAGSPEKLGDFAAELVRVPVDVIVVPSAGLAAITRKATTTIPIVVLAAGELEGSGLVASLSRPDGNVTGTQMFSRELIGKRLELLREMAPALVRVGVLVETATTAEVARVLARYREETDAAGRALGLELTYFTVKRAEELEAAFDSFVARRADAVLVYATPFMFQHRKRLADLALQHCLPATFETRQYVEEGGLMSYGVILPEIFRRGAVFVDRILKGAKPADLPVEQPTRFELVINLKTVKALGLTIPRSILIRADEVIQ